ncbi:lipopolysaccharide heptosyltransferase I [Hydrogenimonas sp.]
MRLAIVRLTAMGDVIHTLAAIQFIKERRPETEITWFVERKFAGILAGNPQIDHLVPLDLHGLKKDFSIHTLRTAIDRIVSAGPFDRIVDVQGLVKSAIVARIAGKETAGLDGESAKESLASLFYRKKYSVDCAGIAPMRFASLLAQALGIEITETMMLEKTPYLHYDSETIDKKIDTFFSTEKRNVLIVTGASNLSKTYPPERWIETVDLLVEYNVLLIAGSDTERKEAAKIEKATHARLLPPMDLNTLKYTVGRGDLLLGGDTGPSHMAWAMNRPSVLLFGSTPKTMMMETPINVAITSGTKVHPCRFDKSDRSIATIPPEKVAETARRLLA